MSIEIFTDVAEKFLRASECKVLAIKGDWGVGKTYAWHRLTERVGRDMWPPTYCYVSLFGVSSLDEIRSAMLAAMRPADALGQHRSPEVLAKRWLTFVSAGIGKTRSRLKRLMEDTSFGKHVSIAVDTIAPWMTRDMVVCFDDFERISSRLSHEELMGFVSNLRETDGCKVVLIFNEEKLPASQNAYDKYREKVVDLELQFAPTKEDVIEWGLPTELPFRQVAIEVASKLDIVNVRVLKRIVSVIRLLEGGFGNIREEVRAASISSAVIIGWAHFDRSGAAPTTQFLKVWNSYTRALEDKKSKPTGEEERWATRLNDVGFSHFDDFDAAILKVIEQGYLQGSGYEGEAQKRSQLYEKGDLEQAFRGAWQIYRESFEDNAAEVVAALDKEARRAIGILGPMDLNATVTLFRELQRNDLADSLIQCYIQERQADTELFDLRSSPFGSEVSDQGVRAAFAEVHQQAAPTVTLRDAVETMAKGRGWSVEHSRAVEMATADDFYALFKGPLDVQRRPAIQACLLAGEQPSSAGVRGRVLEALRRIAGESSINAIRLREFVGSRGPPDAPV
jgi:KAP family P-loop domain